MASSYSFQAEPQAVAGSRKRRTKKLYRSYEGEEEVPIAANIMFDRRVIRGNTYAAQVVHASAQVENDRIQSENARRAQRRAAGSRTDGQIDALKPRTPEPVEGRKHMDIQTDNYLEELTDRRPEVDEETQTDAYMDRPPLPLFVPTKTGDDKATQVEDDLFDFDLEVEPILEVLVGKTLEQSMQEVLEEEELAAIRARQEKFEQTRNAELAEVQRLEAEARRRFDEKERRLDQEKKRVESERDVEEKVAARAFAKEYLTDLHENVFGNLVDEGHFYDPLVKEVEDVFMPWLTDTAVASLDKVALSRKLAAKVLEAAVNLGRDATDSAVQSRRELGANQTDMHDTAYEKLAEEAKQAEAAAKEAEAAAAAGEEGEPGNDGE